MVCYRQATRGRNELQSFKPCSKSYSEAPRYSQRYRRFVATAWPIAIPLCLVCKMNYWRWHQSKNLCMLTLLFCACGARGRRLRPGFCPSSPRTNGVILGSSLNLRPLWLSGLLMLFIGLLYRDVVHLHQKAPIKYYLLKLLSILILCLDLPQIKQLKTKLKSQVSWPFPFPS